MVDILMMLTEIKNDPSEFDMYPESWTHIYELG